MCQLSKCSIVVLVATLSALAQHSGTIENSSQLSWKFENGAVIAWTPLSENRNASQVETFDIQGHPSLALKILGMMDGAKAVSVRDVAVQPGGTGMIAVAAVYESTEGNQRVRPSASLLIFDSQGSIVSSFAVDPSRTVNRLAWDEQSNLWTMTEAAHHRDSATVPMVVEYTSMGSVLKELLTRSEFPLHADRNRETSEIGRVTMGFDVSGLWFWLPGSTDFVTYSGRGRPVLAKTQLPVREGRDVLPLDVVGASSGRAIAVVREDGKHGESDLGYYNWSASTGVWSRFTPGACAGGRLLGAGSTGQVYALFAGSKVDLCVFRP